VSLTFCHNITPKVLKAYHAKKKGYSHDNGEGCRLRGHRFLDNWEFQYLTTEYGFAEEFYDQSRKGIFLHFQVCLYAEMNRWGPKKRKVTK
jgi:hypothetical protein